MIALVSVAGVFEGADAIKNPPFGLLYVGTALKKAGHDVQIYHFTQHQIKRTVEKILKSNPIAICFGTFTGMQTKMSADMSRMLKEKTDAPIIWGGVHPSLIPIQCIREDYIDAVVVGEGEDTAVELLNHIKKNKGLDTSKLKDVKGICFMHKGKVVLTERRPQIENLDDYAIDWDLVNPAKYVQVVKHWDNKRLWNTITSRGCPHRCTFCYNLEFNPKRRWRTHSVEHVTKEIQHFKDVYGLEAVVFSDDYFFVRKDRAFEILKNINLDWFGELRVNTITPQFAEQVSKSKCHSLFFGWESGSDRILQLMNKDIKVKDTFKAVKIMSKFPEISVSGMGILGVPTETPKEIRMTIDTALKLSELHPNLVLNMGTYLPYPGTPMYNLAKREGFVPPKRTEDWADYDCYAGKIEPTWIKWRSDKTAERLRTIGRCGIHLNRKEYGNWWQSIAKKVLHVMAKQRLKHDFFDFPIELDAFSWYYKKYTQSNYEDVIEDELPTTVRTRSEQPKYV